MLRRLAAFIIGIMTWPGIAAAQPSPWTEAIVSVREFGSIGGFLREVGDWRPAGEGRVERAELDYWRLPLRASARYQRLCAPAAVTGCIRMVRFDHLAQRPVRLALRPWDTGGIFSLMFRSNAVQRVFDAAIARGWWAESQPIAFQFGGSDLRNVVITGPHGINFALYERVSPPFTAFPVGALSQAFNSMRMVRNQPRALAFYRDDLGFQPVFDAPYRDPQPGPSNFSLPQNLVTQIVRQAAALQPMAGETGRVEVMQFVGLTGRDESRHASPPNLGILSLRYPVVGLSAWRERLAARGIEPAYAAENVPISGLGCVDILAVRDPDGSLTEFYERRPAGGRQR